jgi:hypothetical protein
VQSQPGFLSGSRILSQNGLFRHSPARMMAAVLASGGKRMAWRRKSATIGSWVLVLSSVAAQHASGAMTPIERTLVVQRACEAAIWAMPAAGPLVVVVPPAGEKASYFGTFVDAWQTPIEDVGPSGADRGEGARYLFVPPGWSDAVPDGYLYCIEGMTS